MGITMGVFLCILALVGIFAVNGYPTTKRPRLLNLYILLMTLLFIIHFSVSLAAMMVNDHYQRRMMREGWCERDAGDQRTIQNTFGCKGFDGNNTDTRNCNYALANATATTTSSKRLPTRFPSGAASRWPSPS